MTISMNYNFNKYNTNKTIYLLTTILTRIANIYISLKKS